MTFEDSAQPGLLSGGLAVDLLMLVFLLSMISPAESPPVCRGTTRVTKEVNVQEEGAQITKCGFSSMKQNEDT